MRHFAAVILVIMLLSTMALGEIPRIIGYQGRVTDNSGNPVADGNYGMRFRIYDNSGGSGSPLWDSGTLSVTLSGGAFSVVLGESPQDPFDLLFDQDYWMLVTFDSEDQTPLNQLCSTGYAYMASGLVPGTEVIGEVTTAPNAAIAATNTATAGVVYGVYGASASTEGWAVYGDATAPSGMTCGVAGLSASADGRGVLGAATATSGAACAVYGITASTGGCGVFGSVTATSGANTGVWGRSMSPIGRGVHGEAAANSGGAVGGYFESASTAGTGVYGFASSTTGTTFGVEGTSHSSSGTGVYGYTSSTSGTTYGISGRSYSTSGRGVYGYASATTGTTYGGWFMSASTSGRGVHGFASPTTGTTYGVEGVSQSASGTGVYGFATADTGPAYGGRFVSTSTSGTGAHGYVSTTSGTTYGVSGLSASTSGTGVHGSSSAYTGYTFGVWGESASTSGTGVYGYASATTGDAYGGKFETASAGGVAVRGRATATTGVTYGVYGRANSSSGYAGYFYCPSGYAGYFDGDVYVSGSINKSACSFLIDHPLDPENKLLRHNCMESPEHLTVYRGKVLLGADGEAAVHMPDYFKALAKEDEATIHLTAEGRPFLTGYEWSADDVSFTAYGEPGREVSWMVMAQRDDPVIRQLVRPVEEDKGPDNKFCDRGKLLNPTAYGYPESTGRDYELHERTRQRMEDDGARREREVEKAAVLQR